MKTLGLNRQERYILFSSLLLIVLSFGIGGAEHVLIPINSVIGATALIYMAKGHPLGQLLTVVFALGYGYSSWALHYYSEMITYLLMSAPIAAVSFVTWLRHPYTQGQPQVAVHTLTRRQIMGLCFFTPLVTAIFYFVLRWLHTPYLTLSTVSVATSFAAALLTLLRSPFYAMAYAVNDIVLILLWGLAVWKDLSYLPMVCCFFIFLCNDSYAFYCWQRRKKAQQTEGGNAPSVL